MRATSFCIERALASALLSIILAPSLGGCKVDQLSSSGTQIVLLYNEPRGCENLGVVVGHGGGISGAYTKPSVNRQSAENDARNEAAKLGATHLLLYPEEIAQGDGRPASPESTNPPLAHGYGTGSNVTVAGQAYKCPPGAVVDQPLVAGQTGSAFPEAQRPTAISLAPLGQVEHITVFRRIPAEGDAAMTERPVLRVDDAGVIQQVAESLQHVVLDPLKFIPTDRIEIVGALGTQSLLYGFGYLQYAGKEYRLTDGAFEKVLQLRDASAQ